MSEHTKRELLADLRKAEKESADRLNEMSKLVHRFNKSWHTIEDETPLETEHNASKDSQYPKEVMRWTRSSPADQRYGAPCVALYRGGSWHYEHFNIAVDKRDLWRPEQ